MKLVLWLVVPCLALGCSVPDVTFVADDGGDASADDVASDSADSAAGYCIDGAPTPPAGGVCCARGIACYGNCNTPGCDKCAAACTAGEACCVRGSTATCNGPC